MRLFIKHQEQYSRGEAALRFVNFLLYAAVSVPVLYIVHLIIAVVYSIYASILMIYAWFVILFTEKMPEVSYNAYVNYYRYSLNIMASMYNLVDGMPPFSPTEKWNGVEFDIAYPTIVTRKRLLFITFLGWIVVIPQLLYIILRMIVVAIMVFVGFIVVLLNGSYPQGMHKFIVETMRLSARVTMYLSFLYFKYPEFSGEETEVDRMHMPKNATAPAATVEPTAVQAA